MGKSTINIYKWPFSIAMLVSSPEGTLPFWPVFLCRFQWRKIISYLAGDPHWPGRDRAGWVRPTREALHAGGTGSQTGPHCAGARRSVGEAQDAVRMRMPYQCPDATPLGGPVWGDEWRWMAMNGDLSMIHIWYLVKPSISGLVICKITMCHCSVDSIRWFDSMSVPALYALHMPWHHSNFADTRVSRKTNTCKSGGCKLTSHKESTVWVL